LDDLVRVTLRRSPAVTAMFTSNAFNVSEPPRETTTTTTANSEEHLAEVVTTTSTATNKRKTRNGAIREDDEDADSIFSLPSESEEEAKRKPKRKRSQIENEDYEEESFGAEEGSESAEFEMKPPPAKRKATKASSVSLNFCSLLIARSLVYRPVVDQKRRNVSQMKSMVENLMMMMMKKRRRIVWLELMTTVMKVQTDTYND